MTAPLRLVALSLLTTATAVVASALPPLPQPLGIPAAGPTNGQPYRPQPILPGGVVVPLWPEGAPQLRGTRVHEAECYVMSRSVPGRIASITNIHNPSIEVHLVDGSLNTGATVILAAGGGHRTLNVGSEAADLVPYFFNYGVNTVILRNRLRSDGYEPKTDAVDDAMQAIRIVRAYSKEWKLDPARIGIMGFSAGAELAAPAGVLFESWAAEHKEASDPFAAHSARPDFVALVYPGPTPFARDPKPPVPRNAPPSFIMCPGSGDRGHAIWADQYFDAFLDAGIPNLESHIYGNGFHPGSGSTAGITDRNGTPLGKWQDRFIDWFRDLGFLTQPGTPTKAAKDTQEFLAKPPPAPRKG